MKAHGAITLTTGYNEAGEKVWVLIQRATADTFKDYRLALVAYGKALRGE